MNFPLDEDSEHLAGDAAYSVVYGSRPPQVQSGAKSARPLTYTDVTYYQHDVSIPASVTSYQFGYLEEITEKAFKVLEIAFFGLAALADIIILIEQKVYSQFFYYAFWMIANLILLCMVCGVKLLVEGATLMCYFLLNDYGVQCLAGLYLLTSDMLFATSLQTAASALLIICWCCIIAMIVLMIVGKCKHSTAFSSGGAL